MSGLREDPAPRLSKAHWPSWEHPLVVSKAEQLALAKNWNSPDAALIRFWVISGYAVLA